MMGIGNRSFLAIALLLLSASAVAQDASGDRSGDDVFVRLCKEEITKGDSLEIVKEALESRRKALEREVEKACKTAEKQESQLSDLQTKQLPEAEQKLEESGRPALLEEKNRLQKEIDKLVDDTTELARDIARKNDELATLRGFKSGLDGMQSDAFDRMVDEHSPYLELSFDEMSQDALREIMDECSKFDGYAKAKPFIDKAKAVSRAKETYDFAMDVLEQQFDRAKVARAKKQLQGLGKRGLNKVQRDCINRAERGLANFEHGLEAFKAFINRLNGKRQELPNYNKTLLKMDLPSILGREDGDIDAWARDNGIRDVPYLDKVFDKYINIITSDPNAHPDIETEILNQ